MIYNWLNNGAFLKSSSGLLIFLASSIGFLLLTQGKTINNSKDCNNQPQESSDRSYTRILQDIFNPERKPAPRHSIAEIFQQRIDTFKRILDDSPYKKYKPKFIHVTGTKGKGSVCEYIACGLRNLGFSVGVFSSPHMHTCKERIKINKQLISKEDFERLGNWAFNALRYEPWVVFFDFLLAMALRYFSEKNVDYIILEVGIGGRYDSTNIITDPTVCVITSISLDHQTLLGNTIEDIAWQKAGIIKAGCTIVTTTEQKPSVMDVLSKECTLKHANLVIAPPYKNNNDNNVEDNNIATSASHFPVQLQNKGVALAALREILKENKQLLSTTTATLTRPIPTATTSKVSSGYENDYESVFKLCNGFSGFFWPCRMELFTVHDVEVWIDGAHNGESVRVLLEGMEQHLLQNIPYNNHKKDVEVEVEVLPEIWVLFGAGQDKNAKEMLEEVLIGADRVVFVQSKHFKAADIQSLLALVPSIYKHKIIEDLPNLFEINSDLSELMNDTIVGNRMMSVISLLRAHISQHGQRAVLLVCGSLFVAAEARENLFKVIPDQFSKDDWIRQCDAEEQCFSDIMSPQAFVTLS
eukprot:gene1839-3561_t